MSKDYHVDHSISKNTFKGHHGYFIRLFLIHRSSNCQYGSVYEKLFSNWENKKNFSGGFHMSYLTITKLCGIKLPKYSATEQELLIGTRKVAYSISSFLKEDFQITYYGILNNLNDSYRKIHIYENYKTKIGIFYK